MTIGSTRTILVAAGITAVWTVSAVIASSQAPAAPLQQRPPMAEEVFKNIQVLKGIPVDEFMGTMGIFSAALGMSCENCHAADDRAWENYAIDTSPTKRTARRMVTMMAAINQMYFGGRKLVTCFSCHRGGNRPAVTPNLAAIYSEPPPEAAVDVVVQASGAPSVDQIFDKYIRAIGGAQRVAALTSFVAKGTAVGYGPESYDRPIEIYAKAPGQRTTIIRTLDGDSTTVFDGRAGWIAAPHRPLPVLAISGGELAGVKLDAELAFPSRLKDILAGWKVGAADAINDKPVQIVQGTGAGGSLATLYFDSDSGLLVRQLRYADSPVGRMPTEVDYSDYRDVAGVKIPFKFKVTWLDGLENVTLSEVQPNAPIDAAKFAKPAPVAAK